MEIRKLTKFVDETKNIKAHREELQHDSGNIVLSQEEQTANASGKSVLNKSAVW